MEKVYKLPVEAPQTPAMLCHTECCWVVGLLSMLGGSDAQMLLSDAASSVGADDDNCVLTSAAASGMKSTDSVEPAST